MLQYLVMGRRTQTNLMAMPAIALMFDVRPETVYAWRRRQTGFPASVPVDGGDAAGITIFARCDVIMWGVSSGRLRRYEATTHNNVTVQGFFPAHWCDDDQRIITAAAAAAPDSWGGGIDPSTLRTFPASTHMTSWKGKS